MADEDELSKLLSSIGYHKQRIKILKGIAEALVRKYNGRVPNSLEGLLSIPHVGSYVAGAVLSLGYGIPAPMVGREHWESINACLLQTTRRRFTKAVQDVARVLVPKEGH